MVDLVSNTTAPEVARGRGDQLFLIGGAQSVLDYVSGTKPILAGAKRIVKENLSRRRQLSSEAGAAYCHLMCPDKHTVMSDSFPYPIEIHVGREFEAACEGLLHFPVETFQSIAPTRGYMRTDTHWDAFGMIAFVEQALLRLGIDASAFAAAHEAIEQLKFSQDDFFGDLGSKLTPPESESRIFLKRPVESTFIENNVHGNNGAFYIALNKKAPFERLLVFGDSFIISCIGLFSLFFKEIIVVRTPFFHPEMLPMFKPTHVITSNVERYIPNMPTDREAPVALLWAHLLKKEMVPDDRFYEAANALLRQGTGFHERFMATFA